MAVVVERNLAFYVKQDTTHGYTIVVLNPTFTINDWSRMESFFRQKTDEQCLDWTIDMRQIRIVNSLMLGGVVGWNTILRQRDGMLRVVVETDSPSAHLFKLSRLDHIINLYELAHGLTVESFLDTLATPQA